MVVRINGREEDWFTPRLMLGTMGKGMGGIETVEYITFDLTEKELMSMSFFDLTSYMLGFKAGESYAASQF